MSSLLISVMDFTTNRRSKTDRKCLQHVPHNIIVIVTSHTFHQIQTLDLLGKLIAGPLIRDECIVKLSKKRG